MSRLRRLQNQSQSQKERNLAKAMIELDRLVSRLRVPSSVKEQAAMIYRRALSSNLIRGRAIKEMIAASLYAACRMTETPRDLKDFEVILDSKTHKKDVARCYRLLVTALDIHMPIHDPLKCVAKIASKAGVSPTTQQRALMIIIDAKKSRESAGKDPMGFAAAALYLASVLDGEKHTQRELSEAANVADVTVRNRFKAIAAELFPDKFPRAALETGDFSPRPV
jgi:transcription initiation factor TFIIB